jgi:hypothetical protein
LGDLDVRLQNNIKVNITKIQYEDVEWIHLAGGSLLADSCEHGIEPSRFIQSGEFTDQLSDYQTLKKGPTLQSLLSSLQLRSPSIPHFLFSFLDAETSVL